MALLRDFNSLFDSIGNQVSELGFIVDFSTRENFKQLRGFFLNISIREMLDVNDYNCLDMFFPFVVGCIERVTGCQDDTPLKSIRTNYKTVIQGLHYEKRSLG